MNGRMTEKEIFIERLTLKEIGESRGFEIDEIINCHALKAFVLGKSNI